MTTLLAKAFVTAERFEKKLDANGYELIAGHLVKKTMSAYTSWVQGELLYNLKHDLRKQNLGYVFESECAYHCFPDKPNQIRKPDVSFVRADRLPIGLPLEGSLTIAPDFLAEIITPTEKATGLAEKIEDFESVGVPLIWVIYCETKKVQVPHREVSASSVAPRNSVAIPCCRAFDYGSTTSSRQLCHN